MACDLAGRSMARRLIRLPVNPKVSFAARCSGMIRAPQIVPVRADPDPHATTRRAAASACSEPFLERIRLIEWRGVALSWQEANGVIRMDERRNAWGPCRRCCALDSRERSRNCRVQVGTDDEQYLQNRFRREIGPWWEAGEAQEV